ncbi:MAG: hypothetical protein K8S55_15285 [Phycisphaerae bacterium]|nr:hypothetical protein [Phycisphaerae bacterium]
MNVMNVVHVTHEAVEKIGGIGTVIEGLTTADAYVEQVNRTVLLGPLFSNQNSVAEQFGKDGELIFSSLDDIRPEEWSKKFIHIERTYDVGIVYGKRKIHEPYSDRIVEVEVLLIELYHANKTRLNLFKGQLFEKFDVPSHEFQKTWEYEQYVRLAEPGLEALKAIGLCDEGRQMVLLSHEYMGMATALKAVLDGADNIKTVFYAHEVASIRPLVEDTPGHDTMFYNVMKQAERDGKTVEDIFPGVGYNFKHPLVKAARYLDHIFAVGDYVKSELHFLDSHFERIDIDLVYNGIPAEPLTIEEKHNSRALLKQYANALLGETPSWIFTHVARPVLSKGIWRDLRILHEMESMLADRGETVVYFMLGTLGGQRRLRDVRQMESVYGWPANHEYGYPDMCGGEEIIGKSIEIFNRTHKASRAVLVNQWGWSPKVCGDRMPAEMTIADLRRGTDLEFGLSTYEPFGISQLEPLSFGAMCVISNVCGCAGFANAARQGEEYQNVLEGNFLGADESKSVDELLSISIADRDRVEAVEGRRLAECIINRLPRDENARQQWIETGYELARRMSWEHVVKEFFLPSLDRVAEE